MHTFSVLLLCTHTLTLQKITVDPVNKLIECMLNEVHKMHKRIDTLEVLCSRTPLLLDVDEVEQMPSEEPKKQKKQGRCWKCAGVVCVFVCACVYILPHLLYLKWRNRRLLFTSCVSHKFHRKRTNALRGTEKAKEAR